MRAKAKIKEYLIYFLILGLILAVIYFASLKKEVKSTEIVQTAEQTLQPTEAQKLFPVHVAGAVNKPAVYYFEAGSIISDAIAKAGGLKEDASLEKLNLAAALQANQQIIVFTKSEVEAGQDYQQAESQGEGKINLNTATAAELQTLSGIGPETAKTILQHRQEHGPFQQIEDLMEIPGIKENRFQKIKDSIFIP